jgi:hypothetical protein
VFSSAPPPPFPLSPSCFQGLCNLMLYQLQNHLSSISLIFVQAILPTCLHPFHLDGLSKFFRYIVVNKFLVYFSISFFFSHIYSAKDILPKFVFCSVLEMYLSSAHSFNTLLPVLSIRMYKICYW